MIFKTAEARSSVVMSPGVVFFTLSQWKSGAKVQTQSYGGEFDNHQSGRFLEFIAFFYVLIKQKIQGSDLQ